MRLNVGAGQQSKAGAAASSAGTIANGVPCGSAPAVYVPLQRSHTHPVAARADEQGALWLLVLTDSAFEGPTGIYFTKIAVTLTPLATGDGGGLANVSTRAKSGASGDTIAGFVLGGTAPRPVLIRGVGPQLAHLGVPGTLPDPHDMAGNRIASNDDWAQAPNVGELEQITHTVGAFPLDPGSKDAAMLISLFLGIYSVSMRELNGLEGTGLVEIYRVP